MARIYEGEVHAAYHTFTVSTEEVRDEFLPEKCFTGQVNGLCGTQMSGGIMLTTGIHHGVVGITVDVEETAPPLDDRWEDIVEAPFWNKGTSPLWLNNFYDGTRCTFSLKPGERYRIRFCGSGLDQAAELDTNVERRPVDRYSLTFWPAPHAPDTVLKQTSKFAAAWHGIAKRYKAPFSWRHFLGFD